MPLHWKEILFLGVTGLAGRHKISFLALSSSAERDQVIHGEVFSPHPTAAVITLSLGNPPVPPLGFAKTASLFLFSPYLLFGYVFGVKHHDIPNFKSSSMPGNFQ